MVRTFGDFNISVPAGASGERDVVCPRCSQQRRNKTARCLSVNVDLGVWICFHCEWRGSLTAGEESSPRRVYRAPTIPRQTDIPERALAFFRERGITEGVLARNRIGVAPTYMPQVEDHRQAIFFPYYRGETLVNIKWRTLDKHFRMHGGAERILYGINDLAETTIIVEGEIDKLSCEMAGFRNTVSVPDGAPAANAKSYASKFDFLDTPELEIVKRWIVAVDNDTPGKRLEEELVRRFGPERCSRVAWPEGCKDANDVLVKRGYVGLKACIDEAKPFPIEGLIAPADVRDLFNTLYDRGLPPGVNPGWDNLANLYTVKPGEWTLITGIPAHGKTHFLDALLVNLILNHGWRVAICSPENQPIQRHMAGMAAKIIGKPFAGPDRMDEGERDLAFYVMDEHVSFILPEAPTVAAVLDRARIAVSRQGITGLVVDPWNELEHSRPVGMSETEYIGHALATFRRFARQYGVHLWLVAHPTKLQTETKKKRGDNEEPDKEPLPTAYSVSGSANWRNKADNVIVIWRDLGGSSNVVEVHVQKVRFREVGQPGMATLIYDREQGGIFTDTGCWSPAGRELRPPPPPERPRYPDADLPDSPEPFSEGRSQARTTDSGEQEGELSEAEQMQMLADFGSGPVGVPEPFGVQEDVAHG